MTTLTQEIVNFQESMAPQLPAEVLEALLTATDELVKSDIVKKGLKVGDTFPDFSLFNAKGEEVSLKSLLEKGPLIVSFYRGGWCPYCSLELHAYQRSMEAIRDRGATLVAISPQLPDDSLSASEKEALEFEVLSDAGNELSNAVGLVFELAEQLKPIYTNFGFELPKCNGDDSWTLPIPATYVVKPNAVISYAYVNADYTQRAEPEEVIAQL